MKKTIVVALFLVAGLAVSEKSSAQLYKTALGVRLSSSPPVVNNSITFKYFLSERSALEALLSFGDPVAIGLMYEVHRPLNVEGLQWFYGGGGYIGFDSDALIGAAGIIGLDYKFNNLPINLSLDWKPELNLLDDINFEPAAIGLSVRFVFGSN